jgi:hypothetical protein
MNHTTLLTIGMIVAAATLIGAVGIGMQTASAWRKSYSPDGIKADIEKSLTDFNFKQKLKNNCSGFAICTNTGAETLGGV